ncbi:MAG: hypothetical protein LBR53_08545 [Deltaproteobacteria bacterium]|nr:hypothetical protein [Deltaproteobacteria bacterium]
MVEIENIFMETSEFLNEYDRKNDRYDYKLLDTNQFLVQCFIPSSFAIQLSKDVKDVRPSLINLSENKVPDENIFLSLLSGDYEIDDLVNNISPKLRKCYFRLINLLDRSKVTVSTRTKSHPFSITITPEQAAKRKKLIKKIPQLGNEREIEIVGLLVIGDLIKHKFGVKTDTELFKGGLSKEAEKELKKFHFDTKVRAKLLIVTKNTKSDVTKYTRMSLRVERDS